eukprot:snap_masked-scaffold_10-processed-gene-0.29-mRNA-1 protein AED:1.00 eAED:1.00 QI:0/0/0/0/1/1/2/0/72
MVMETTMEMLASTQKDSYNHNFPKGDNAVEMITSIRFSLQFLACVNVNERYLKNFLDKGLLLLSWRDIYIDI